MITLKSTLSNFTKTALFLATATVGFNAYAQIEAPETVTESQEMLDKGAADVKAAMEGASEATDVAGAIDADSIAEGKEMLMKAEEMVAKGMELGDENMIAQGKELMMKAEEMGAKEMMHDEAMEAGQEMIKEAME